MAVPSGVAEALLMAIAGAEPAGSELGGVAGSVEALSIACPVSTTYRGHRDGSVS